MSAVVTPSRIPSTQCTRCGYVAASVVEHCVHTSTCPEPNTRPVTCRRCAAENWRRTHCSDCGKELPR